VHPSARIAPALWLAARGANSAVDISDGLLSDLEHIARASDVGLDVALDDLPLVDGVDADQAARGGEEYELAVTAPSSLDVAAFAGEFDLPLTRIGRVVEPRRSAERGESAVEATHLGTRVAPGGGWDHLS
jgi:thiamine-monophosphate kinase